MTDDFMVNDANQQHIFDNLQISHCTALHLSSSNAAYCSSSTSVIMRFPSGSRRTTLLVPPKTFKILY